MKICVVVPSAEYLVQAGVRIRYNRIQPYLAALGHSLVLEPIENFRGADHLDGDVVLFSKCHDARAVALAHLMRASGRHVGADFFDDLFSQIGDSRFVRQRAWMRDMTETMDFALCSTPRMREILAQAMPGVPTHVLNDPIDGLDRDAVATRLSAKRERALATRTIPVAWFGIGDNPHFSVGLSDLAAFGAMLKRLGETGFAINLQILTNRRALTEEGLRLIGRLAVPHQVAEWTLEAERALLDEALVAFLPVNGQSFSTAKSLNRAVTTLASGTQVLSAGVPLYEALDAFLYRDPDSLVADLVQDELRLRADTVSALAALLSVWADPENETAKLVDFLGSLAPLRKNSSALAIIHGRRSPPAIHKSIQRLGQLSVASPFASSKLNYDVRVCGGLVADCLLDIELSDRAQARLPPDFAGSTISGGADKRQHRLKLIAPAELAKTFVRADVSTLAETAINYESVMRYTQDILHFLYPGTTTLLSEAHSPLDIDPSISSEEPAVLSIAEAMGLERILFVANADLPSLQISFIKPLQSYVDEGSLLSLVLVDTELKSKFHVNPGSVEAEIFVQKQLEAFRPTLIVFCRYSGPLGETYRTFAGRENVPIIYHLDDDLLNIPPEIGAKKFAYHNDPSRLAIIRTLIASAKAVYASTDVLYRRYKALNIAEVVVTGRIYCSSDVRRAPIMRAVRKIGYMGGGDHAPDLQIVLPAIARVMDKYSHIEFELFGGMTLPDALVIYGDRIRVHPSIPVYDQFLKRFSEVDWDIGICPLVANDFNAAKANTKWVDYTSLGIAVLATGGMGYDDCCSDGAGTLAQSTDEWFEALDAMVSENGRCFRQTSAAQEKLRTEYSPEAHQRQLVSIIETVLGRSLVKDNEVIGRL